MPDFFRYTYNGVTVRATRRRSSSRDDKKYMRTVRRGEQERLVHYGDPNLPMQRDNPERRENFLSRHSCGEKKDPFKPGFWACYDWASTDEKSVDMSEEQNTESVVFFGGEVKALGGGKVGGYLVQFGDAKNTDLEGDFFTDNTDFDLDELKRTTIYYNHGLDPVLKSRRLGRADMSVKDAGIWLEGQLDLRDEYEQAVYQLVEAGKLGWSSGTAAHLVEREQKSNGAFHITHWPLGLDASLTPTPAEPRTAAIPIKSLENVEPLQVKSTQQESGEDSAEANAHEVNININVNGQTPATDNKPEESREMADETKETVGAVENEDATSGNGGQAAADVVTKDEFNEFKSQFTDFSDQLSGLMEKLQNSGPLKDVGFIAPDDEETKPETKSFADFLLAIYNGNVKRLTKVYGSTKDLSGETGTAGGYLVPEEFTNQLLQIAETTSQILPRVTRVPVNSDTGRYPALDQYITPTAGSGQTAMAAGVVATTTSAGGPLTETEPGFEMIQWRVNKVGGYTEVENELIADSPQSIEVLLTRLFGVAVSARTEQMVLRGTGAGEPLGILNAACAVAHTPGTNNTFAWADATTMQSRFKTVGGTPVWIIHPGIWPDIGDFETSAGGGVFQANLQAALGNNILGYEILQSEHLPQDDNSGCVVLADLSAYLLFERSGLSIAFSEHAAFTSDKGTWRFTQRLDGQPWLKSAITLADPQGSYTMSPFVYLND